MKIPKRIILSGGAISTFCDAIVEDPYTEPFVTLKGVFEDRSARIYTSFNWKSVISRKDEVKYGNYSAIRRVLGFEEAMRAYKPHKRMHNMTRVLGDAHTHEYPDDMRPSIEDFEDACNWMKVCDSDKWIMVIARTRLAKPEGIGIEYDIVNGRPFLRIMNEFRNLGIELAFVGHYVFYDDHRYHRVEVPLTIDPRTIKKHF